MVLENSGMLMEIFLKVNGKMIKLMVKVLINTETVLNILETEKTIYRMDMGLKPGSTAVIIKVFTKKEKNMAKVTMYEPINLHIMANG